MEQKQDSQAAKLTEMVKSLEMWAHYEAGYLLSHKKLVDSLWGANENTEEFKRKSFVVKLSALPLIHCQENIERLQKQIINALPKTENNSPNFDELSKFLIQTSNVPTPVQ